MDAKELGNRIKIYRQIADLTQQELADKTNISLMSIRRYEKGERAVTAPVLSAISRELGIKTEDLLTEDNSKILFAMKNNLEKYSSDKTKLTTNARPQNNQADIRGRYTEIITLFGSLTYYGQMSLINYAKELLQDPWLDIKNEEGVTE